MKSYDLNLYKADHKMKITLQAEEYKGHVFVKCGGNCKGASMIKFAAEFFEDCDEEDVARLKNDCSLRFYEDEEYFTARLTNSDGKVLGVELDSDDIANIIVAVEIISQVAE